MPSRTYLRLTAPVAPRALLPEDPALALALARELLTEPKMSNHTLGLWGYHGRDADGDELTIQATGLGGAAAAIVLEELAQDGVRCAVRIGTGEGTGAIAVGSAVAVREALALDGASQRLGASGAIAADAALTAGLAGAGLEPVTAATVDLPGAASEEAAGAAVADLASAPLFALGARLGVAVGCALVVAGAPGSEPAGDQELEEEALALGRSAAAVARSAATSPAS
jgi:uridine phosphorylase